MQFLKPINLEKLCDRSRLDFAPDATDVLEPSNCRWIGQAEGQWRRWWWWWRWRWRCWGQSYQPARFSAPVEGQQVIFCSGLPLLLFLVWKRSRKWLTVDLRICCGDKLNDSSWDCAVMSTDGEGDFWNLEWNTWSFVVLKIIVVFCLLCSSP